MRTVLSLWCCTVVLWVVATPEACAHAAPASTLKLDIHGDDIAVDARLPLDQLKLALPELAFDAATIASESDLSSPKDSGAAAGVDKDLKAKVNGLSADDIMLLYGYLKRHISLTTDSGKPYTIDLNSLSIDQDSDTPYLAATLRFLSPYGNDSKNFNLHYDAILHLVVTHKVYVALRSDFQQGVFASSPVSLDVIHFQHENIQVKRTTASPWVGFMAMFASGAQHIAKGADHLLFLLCLLLPAPLFCRAGRWQGTSTVTQCLATSLKTVTAFTCGHTLTLGLAAFRVIQVPAGPVEILIAVSILVSAIHALRPVFGRYVVILAGVFGLVHGLAFANELSGLGLDRSSLFTGLVGFNLGIEARQLLIVAGVIPFLMMIARVRVYASLRVIGAAFGSLAAMVWIGERAWGLSGTLTAVANSLIDHWLWFYSLLILIAGGCLLVTFFKVEQYDTKIRGVCRGVKSEAQNTGQSLR